eukprot:TRINITY_DN1986_c0_g1_i1.p2 TRINITY_DN1986_c0_g1~~TRINITY_DN1986_c0_g1_i1.p2  ORF type:complete len:119 (+),score=32.56 TRINITY_DN1986_c0_g1_i1:69-425(+)
MACRPLAASLFRQSLSVQRKTLLGGSVRSFGDHSGTVKFFDPQRGFGFISCEEKEYFVHYSSIEAQHGEFRSLADGEEVEFDLMKDDSGREKAVRVTGPNGAPVKGSLPPGYDNVKPE